MNSLKIIPLGGMGTVAQNMFVYQYEDELLIIDCGIGFPDIYTPGVDILIPDITYLKEQVSQGKKIVGLIFSHGHDDHIAALPYLIKDLPQFPIYASTLTAAFATERFSETSFEPNMKVIEDKKPLSLGQHFKITSFAITHSVPDTKHFFIETPEGLTYHGSDFKLDENPVDGVKSDLKFIEKYSGKINLMLMDCLRVERLERTRSESSVGPHLEEELKTTKGKFIVTLMSSHIHRIQQVVNLAEKYHRKVAFVGRSVEKNALISKKLNKLKDGSNVIINRKKIKNYQDGELILIVAGSQGQEGSSMMRAVYGMHPQIQIKKTDKVVFSADAIPGNELSYYQVIDELSLNKVDVVYPQIKPGIHASGHASSLEQKELLSLVKPKYVMPIGGSNRHRRLFVKRVALKCGLQDSQILIPNDGDIINQTKDKVFIDGKIEIKPQLVDGFGVGDVGPVVISDRQILGTEGIIVILLKKDVNNQIKKNFIEIITRGFVFVKESEDIMDFIREKTRYALSLLKKGDFSEAEFEVQRKLARSIKALTGRQPMIYVKVI
jgi:ribonuclease J